MNTIIFLFFISGSNQELHMERFQSWNQCIKVRDHMYQTVDEVRVFSTAPLSKDRIWCYNSETDKKSFPGEK